MRNTKLCMRKLPMKNQFLAISVLTILAFSIMQKVQAQTHLKQSELKNFTIGKYMENGEPQNACYLDGTKLKPGKYSVLMDQEGRDSKNNRAVFEVNSAGHIDGELIYLGLDPSISPKVIYKNDTLIRIETRKNGKLIRSNYFENGIFYEKEYEANGDFKSESRSIKGKQIYSKGMNISGWDIQDELKGTREFYHGKTNVIESRTTVKNLGKGISKMEEKFDEKGILLSKELNYTDGKKKVVNKDGSYEIIVPTNSGDKISQYSSKGKLLKTFVSAYPTIGNER